MKYISFLISVFVFFLISCDDVEEPIKIGIVSHVDLAKTSYDFNILDIIDWKIKDINEQGGIYGREVELIIQSIDDEYKESDIKKTLNYLIEDEKVSMIIAGFEYPYLEEIFASVEESSVFMFYYKKYFGSSNYDNVYYTGTAPNQQVIYMVEWLKNTKQYNNAYLIGADYGYSSIANRIVKDSILSLGIDLVGEDILYGDDFQFDRIIEEIKTRSPEIIINTLNRRGTELFFRRLSAEKMYASEYPVISLFLDEMMVNNSPIDLYEGHYVVDDYFMNIDNQENKKLVSAFLFSFSQDSVINSDMVAAYNGLLLWEAALKKRRSMTVASINDEIGESDILSPAGRVKIDVENNYLYKNMYIGQVNENKRIDVISKIDYMLKPNPQLESYMKLNIFR